MNNLKIAICDDDARCLEQVITIAKKYAGDRMEKNISFSSFSHPEDLLEASEKIGGFDIYILDIVMPGMNGLQLGVKLRDAGYDGKIIYLTSSEEYALDSFKVKAFQYLIKPIQNDPFYDTLDDAISAISVKKDKSIMIKTKERSVKITFDSILYAELVKRTVLYHLIGGKITESISLRASFSESIAPLLEDQRFTQCGAGTVVNMDHITEIGAEEVIFEDKEQIFLGKKSCRELRFAWNEFLFSDNGGF